MNIRTCAAARKWIAAKIGMPTEQITVDKAHRKIIVAVKVGDNTKVFNIEDAPFIYTIPDEQWEDLIQRIIH